MSKQRNRALSAQELDRFGEELDALRARTLAQAPTGASAETQTPGRSRASWDRSAMQAEAYSTTTGIFPMRACHSLGPVLCTDSPALSTATVTGMSCTVNS